MWPQRIWFSSCFGLKKDVDFDHFEIGYVFHSDRLSAGVMDFDLTSIRPIEKHINSSNIRT